MRPLRPLLPFIGALALALCACPGDDGSSSPTTTSGPTTNGGETSPSTTVTGDPMTPEVDETTADDPSTTLDPSTGPDDPTMGTTATTTTTTDSALPRVVMETSLGTMVIELDDEAAPVTTANFLEYVDAGFYDGMDGAGATIFHRVIDGFVAQGGGLTDALVQKPTMAPIVNESGNGLMNVRGTIAMARTTDPNSATAQFYFNLVDNGFLDDPPGYAVFGQIVEGLDVMDAIGAIEVDRNDLPLVPVIILSATRE